MCACAWSCIACARGGNFCSANREEDRASDEGSAGRWWTGDGLGTTNLQVRLIRRIQALRLCGSAEAPVRENSS